MGCLLTWRVARSLGGADPAGRVSLRGRVAGTAPDGGNGVDRLPQGGNYRMRVGVVAAVAEVEGVVEGRRVGALDVLEHRLQPVEPLGESGLRGPQAVVFVPEREEPVARAAGKRRDERLQVGALVGGLVGGLQRRRARRRGPPRRDRGSPGAGAAGKGRCRRARPAAPPPSGRGARCARRCFRPAGRGAAAAQRVLESTGGTEEREVCVAVGGIHGLILSPGVMARIGERSRVR